MVQLTLDSRSNIKLMDVNDSANIVNKHIFKQ